MRLYTVIDDDINTTGASNLSCYKGVTGRIPLRKPASYLNASVEIQAG